jgi:hypothetical protein
MAATISDVSDVPYSRGGLGGWCGVGGGERGLPVLSGVLATGQAYGWQSGNE